MSGNKQRRFTDEFKRGAVRLTRTSGRRVERVANDFGIAKSTLSRWRSEHEQADLLEGLHEDVTKELARVRRCVMGPCPLFCLGGGAEPFAGNAEYLG